MRTNEIARLLCLLASTTLLHAQVDKAQTLIVAGQLAEAEATLLSMPERTAEVWNTLAWLYDRQGARLQAEQAYLRALAVMPAAPQYRQLYVRTSIGLAAVYIDSEQYPKAEAIVTRLRDTHPDAEPAEQAALAGNLGVILAQRGQLESAAALFTGVAARCESTTPTTAGPELWEVCAIALANHAEVRLRLGDQPGAVAAFERSLRMMDAVPNPNPPTLATTLANYATTLVRMGHRTEAESLYRKATALAETRLGPLHPVLGELLAGYAKVLHATGHKREARRMRQDAERILTLSAKENRTGYTVDVRTLRAR